MTSMATVNTLNILGMDYYFRYSLNVLKADIRFGFNEFKYKLMIKNVQLAVNDLHEGFSRTAP